MCLVQEWTGQVWLQGKYAINYNNKLRSLYYNYFVAINVGIKLKHAATTCYNKRLAIILQPTLLFKLIFCCLQYPLAVIKDICLIIMCPCIHVGCVVTKAVPHIRRISD